MGSEIQGMETRVAPLTITIGQGNTGIYCVEASNDAKYPTRCRTTLLPNVNSVKVEKPCLKGCTFTRGTARVVLNYTLLLLPGHSGFLVARERAAVIPEELTLNSRRSMCGIWSPPHTPLSHSNYELTGATTPAKNGCQGLRSISNEGLGPTIR